uniref:Large ribosomal subunit protein uL30m n=1 Tax=Pectinophora gossypiella TaxID=13191 RepID=A0A1E1WH02_PECGO
MNRQLLNIFHPLKSFSRQKGYKHPGGIRYPGGITYYPRDPTTHKDPEDYTPPKLFRVERIKPVKNNAWWLKDILAEFRIHEEERVTVVKNIPELNSKLWKIKHLVKITPITFPYGEPSEQDIKYTVLKENGQCVVTKTLEPAPQQIEALEKFDNDVKKMDSTTIKRDSRHKWNNAFGGGF